MRTKMRVLILTVASLAMGALAAAPAGQAEGTKLKAEHPAAQKAFEEIVRGLQAIEQEMAKGAPTKAPRGKFAGDAGGAASKPAASGTLRIEPRKAAAG